MKKGEWHHYKNVPPLQVHFHATSAITWSSGTFVVPFPSPWPPLHLPSPVNSRQQGEPYLAEVFRRYPNPGIPSCIVHSQSCRPTVRNHGICGVEWGVYEKFFINERTLLAEKSVLCHLWRGGGPQLRWAAFQHLSMSHAVPCDNVCEHPSEFFLSCIVSGEETYKYKVDLKFDKLLIKKWNKKDENKKM